MAHKTLVNGTAYEISGGKPLIDGTAYSIKNGKPLVGGTAYEIEFGSPMVTVTLNTSLGSGAASKQEKLTLTFPEPITHPTLGTGSCESITFEAETGLDGLVFEVPLETSAYCSVSNGSYGGKGSVTLNGTEVGGGYTHIITQNTRFYLCVKSDGGKGYGIITITEQ